MRTPSQIVLPAPPPSAGPNPAARIEELADSDADAFSFFTPPLFVLVTQRGGPLDVFVDGVDAPPTSIPLTDLVSTGGEGGMMGLEVDPGFDENGYVYVCMASSVGPENDVRVVRLTMSRPSGATVEGRTDIITGMPHNDLSRGRHSGCRPRFGPDGYLWVGTGDAAMGTTPWSLMTAPLTRRPQWPRERARWYFVFR